MIDNNPIPPILVQQPWRKKYPAVLSGILSFLEFFFTIAIIGCEVGSMLIDITTATIYVGLWASLFFMVAWISQAASCMLTLYLFYIEFIQLSLFPFFLFSMLLS